MSASKALQTVLYGLAPVPYLSWRARREGEGFVLRLPLGEMTVFSEPDAIKDIMGLRADQFRTADTAPFLEPFVGRRSLLMLDSEAHRTERSVMVQSLRGETMSSYEPVMVAAAERDMATWPRNRAFALHPRMQAITLDVMLRVVLGADEREVHEQFTAALRPWLHQAGSLLVLVPALRHELGGLSPWGRLVSHRRRFDELLSSHIHRLRADPHLANRTDVLSRLLPHLDDEALHDEVLTMLAAGHDTSATALSWAFDFLLHHPAALARARAGNAIDGGDDYLDAVVKETLRLRPPVLDVGRTLTRDAVIGGHRLAAGTAATASILLAQRRSDRYEAPLEFRPERFLGQPADPHTWLAFGGGVRRCIGAALATMEVKAVLRTVLDGVDLQPARRQLERPRRRAVTMIPARGTRVRAAGMICQPSTSPITISTHVAMTSSRSASTGA